MREQGTLVAPRRWAEEGIGRANLNEHEKPTVLRLRCRRDHPDGRAEINGKNLPTSRQKPCISTKKTKDKNSKPHNTGKKWKISRSGGGLKVS